MNRGSRPIVILSGAPCALETLATSSDLTPLVLLVDDQEWTSRAIENILRPRGHVVLKAYTAQQALDLVSKVSPDVVLVDVELPDLAGTELVRRLREAPTIHRTTPLLLLTRSGMGRAARLEALGAGAWDILTHPVEPNEMILRLDTFVSAKQAADRVRDEGLTDPDTGLYNVRGILQRTKEVNADAVRFRRPLTCVAFGLAGHGDDSAPDANRDDVAEAVAEPVASALRTITRLSDTIGRLGPGEFVVLAPGTDEKGAVRLAHRVLEALGSGAQSDHPKITTPISRIRAGLCSVDSDDPMSPEDLLLRATMALRKAQSTGESFRVRTYEA